MIRDTGAGMDEEVAKLALEPFYSTKEMRPGWGFQYRPPFELNDAALGFDSKAGEGTTVTIRFRRRN